MRDSAKTVFSPVPRPPDLVLHESAGAPESRLVHKYLWEPCQSGTGPTRRFQFNRSPCWRKLAAAITAPRLKSAAK